MMEKFDRRQMCREPVRNEAPKPEPPVTYGVYGLTEWEALIPVGKARIRIPFEGGSMSGFGITPATFTTSDAKLKRIIENSPQYRNRRIVKIR